MKQAKQFFLTALALFLALAHANAAEGQPQNGRIVVAYIAGWTTGELPNPRLMTHINYAFGHVAKTFDRMEIQNPEMLKRVVDLRKGNPSLKVVLSVGGWTSGNFSEMAASSRLRKAFAKSCLQAVKDYNLDGIDIDWEYPTSSEAGISSSPDDTRNFTLLLRDLRKALGKARLLTIATIADAKFVDFKACMRYLDYVNIMAYDVANPPKHHTTLFRSALSGRITVAEAVDAHLKAGVPARQLCLGMPLYGRGDHANKTLDKYMKTGRTGGKYVEQWDSVGQVPYLVDSTGTLVWGFDNPRSIAAKCQFIIDKGLLGGMYWETTEDNAQQDLMQTVWLSLLKNGKGTMPMRRVLLLDAAAEELAKGWLEANKDQVGRGYDITVFTPDDYVPGYFDRFHMIIAADEGWKKLGDAQVKELSRYEKACRGSLVQLNRFLKKSLLEMFKCHGGY